MRRLGKSYDVKVYSGAEYGFFDDSRAAFNEAAALDAWTRTVTFLKANLSPTAT
jgi:dienelactone hydrolase